jgi:glucokinase
MEMPYRDNFIEEYLATRWFLSRYKELTGKVAENVKELISFSDPAVTEIFKEFADHLTELLIAFIRMDNPQVMVMGGNISHASGHFLARVIANLKSRSIDVPIKKALLGENAAMLGAAFCWSEEIQPAIH